MSLQASVAQLHIISGIPQDATHIPGLFVDLAPNKAVRARMRDALFLHISVSGPIDETEPLLNDLVNQFRQTFYHAHGGAMAAMRQSIQAVNQYLLRRNLQTTDENRRIGSLVCAILRGEELFMAQVGEAFAFIGHNFGLEPLPAERPNTVTPLGQQVALDVRYMHNWLTEGDTLLLTDPRIAHLPNQAFIPALVGSDLQSGQSALTDLLKRNTARLIFAVLVPETITQTNRNSAPLQATTTEKIVRPQLDDELATAQEIRARRRARQAPPVQPPSAIDEVVDAEIIKEDELSSEPTLLSEPPQPEPERQIPPNPVGSAEYTARHAAAGALDGGSRFLRWLAQMLTVLRGSSPQDDYAPRGERAFALLLVLGIPILVTFAITSAWFRWNGSAEIATVKEELTNTLLQADAAATQADKRAFYVHALDLANQALEIAPNDGQVQAARQRTTNALDDIDDITRLDAIFLYQYPAEAQLRSIALGEGDFQDIYVLDDTSDTLYRHITNEKYLLTDDEPISIVAGGESVQTHPVGDLLDIMWRSAGNSVPQAGIAALDVRGALVSWFPAQQNKVAAPLGLASEWQNPLNITTYQERLYVLDSGTSPANAQIWRYLPDGNALNINEDFKSLIYDDLESAIDMVINPEDASVLVLYADGRLRKFTPDVTLWDENILANNGLNVPLVAPTAIKLAGAGLNTSIFVLDPGSARLVQFSLGGRVLNNYKANLENNSAEFLSRVTDFVVLESPLRILLVGENFIAEATLR